MMIQGGSSSDRLLETWTRVLDEQGVHALLVLLNQRTPHRYTGVFRYDDPMLRNLYLVDTFDRQVRRGADAAMADTYCVIVGEQRKSLVLHDVHRDPRVSPRGSVVSYCGVLLSTAGGGPFGTLCHYDPAPCDENVNDIHLLEVLAPLIMATIRREIPDELGAAVRALEP